MSSILRSAKIEKTNADTFPLNESVVLANAISITITVSGANSVNYTFLASVESGTIRPGTSAIINTANSDGITDTIIFDFVGACTVLVEWVDGVSGSTSGGATAANQQIIIEYLNGTTTSVLSGNTETTSLVAHLIDGITDVCLSCSIFFEGSGGSLNGVVVKNGFIAGFSGTLRNQVSPILFTVPTIPDGAGNQRVLVSYTKI